MQQAASDSPGEQVIHHRGDPPFGLTNDDHQSVMSLCHFDQRRDRITAEAVIAPLISELIQEPTDSGALCLEFAAALVLPVRGIRVDRIVTEVYDVHHMQMSRQPGCEIYRKRQRGLARGPPVVSNNQAHY